MYTTSDILLAIIRALPYPQHINELDLEAMENKAVHFKWKGQHFFVYRTTGNVEELVGNKFYTSAIAIILQHIIIKEL